MTVQPLFLLSGARVLLLSGQPLLVSGSGDSGEGGDDVIIWEALDSEVQAGGEKVSTDGDGLRTTLARAKVPGGWIIRWQPDSAAATMVFLPDAEHAWDGSSLP